MAADSDLSIRPMTAHELAVPLQWAAAEGWNPGLADPEPFHAADPDGFLMAFLGKEPIGCISVVRYDDSFGFLGLYIVRPDYRGQGHGIRLWRAGLRHLDGCAVGLDGVVAQQANYARSGFSLAYRNVRYSGFAPARPTVPDPRVTPVSAEMIDAIAAFDRRYFPAERKAFLRSWLRRDRRRALALVEGGELYGYGVLRACRAGFKIGPLFAESATVADALFEAALSECGGSSVSIDVPEPNESAAALASRFGFAPVFETARMYRGPAPKIQLEGVFGVTTLELG